MAIDVASASRERTYKDHISSENVCVTDSESVCNITLPAGLQGSALVIDEPLATSSQGKDIIRTCVFACCQRCAQLVFQHAFQWNCSLCTVSVANTVAGAKPSEAAGTAPSEGANAAANDEAADAVADEAAGSNDTTIFNISTDVEVLIGG